MGSASDNKKVIIICFSLIVIALIIFSFTRPKKEKFIFNESKMKEKYKINEVVPIYINNEQLAKKYLAEYVNFMLYYPEKAYDLLNDEEKKSRFNSFEEFEFYINQIKSIKLEQAEVKRYSYTIYNKKNTFYIIDNSGNTFRFIENSIMDYSVILN